MYITQQKHAFGKATQVLSLLTSVTETEELETDTGLLCMCSLLLSALTIAKKVGSFLWVTPQRSHFPLNIKFKWKKLENC